MPFTFAHPALVIPLLRCQRRWPWLSATGLVAGSIAPDFEKFFRLKLVNDYSHTVASLFYFSCPVGLVLAFLFHGLVRQPLVQHLPAPLHRRLARWPAVEWRVMLQQNLLGVLASIWLGAATHLLWDSFTHHNAILARIFPWLEWVVVLPHYQVHTYTFLALLSSLGGELAIGYTIWQLPEQTSQSASTAALLRYWAAVALLAVGLLGGWVLATRPSQHNAFIAAFSAAMVAVVAVSAWVYRCGKLRL